MSARHADLFREVAATMAAAAESSLPADIERAVDIIDGAFVGGRKLLVFGNGGSSADAQHLVCLHVPDRLAYPARPPDLDRVDFLPLSSAEVYAEVAR